MNSFRRETYLSLQTKNRIPTIHFWYSRSSFQNKLFLKKQGRIPQECTVRTTVQERLSRSSIVSAIGSLIIIERSSFPKFRGERSVYYPPSNTYSAKAFSACPLHCVNQPLVLRLDRKEEHPFDFPNQNWTQETPGTMNTYRKNFPRRTLPIDFLM